MNYQILVGKTINIMGTDITVTSVKPVKGPDHIVRYCVNEGPIYSKINIGSCVSIIEDEIEEQNRPKGLFSRFGLFKRTFVLNPENLTHTEKCTVFQPAFGIRTYGYRTVAIFFHLRLGLTVRQIEFCWNEKVQYDKGVLPETLADFTKVF